MFILKLINKPRISNVQFLPSNIHDTCYICMVQLIQQNEKEFIGDSWIPIGIILFHLKSFAMQHIKQW